MNKISLVKDTIDSKDIDLLIEWLKTYPILTKNKLTVEFEEKYSKYQNRKYSVFLNSGSSANLAMIYSLLVSGALINKNIIVPAVSWTTTVTPIMQFGLNPILCECDKDTLGLDINHLKKLIVEHNPSVVMLVHVLGVPNKMNEIIELCEQNNIILLEDSCESIGSTYNDIKTGSFGLMSSFSFYFGHHMSVSPDTPIPFLDKNNLFNIDSIENIYNKYYRNIDDIKIITFDNNYNTLYKSPSNIVKHKFNDKKIFRIKLSNGRYVEITEDHSVFTYKKSNFDVVEKRGFDINLDDYIVVPSKLPKPVLKTELNFLNFCKKFKNEYFLINYDEEDFNTIKFKWNTQENKNKFTNKKRKVLPLEYFKTNTENLRIAKKNTPKNKYIPYKYEITEDLCRLIGYFLAEGSYKKSGINFSFNINEIEYLNDIKDIIKKIFGLKCYDRIDSDNNSHTISVSSETLLIFFRDFLNIESGAKNKRIPNFIFSSDEKCISSFLYGYFAGDGTEYKNTISVTSISKKLINDISYLFNTIGLNGAITVTKPAKKEHYIKNRLVKNKNIQYKFIVSNLKLTKNSIIVSDIKNILPYKKLTFPVTRNSNANYKCNDYIKNFNNEYELNENLKNFVNGDLMVLKVKHIEEITPDYEYVYDFYVPGYENFVGGWQPICLHNSTIEGGMVCTDDYELYSILKSIRAHGWDRDLDEPFKSKLKDGFDIDEFKDLYTFYYPGFNLRSTDLQAFIGINQLDKIEICVELRQNNFKLYQSLIKNDYWKIKELDNTYVSNFAYPIIHPNVKKIASELSKGGVDCRPLVCGSIGSQPYWIKEYGKQSFEFADIVDKYGLYVPNNPELTVEEITYICDIINKNM